MHAQGAPTGLAIDLGYISFPIVLDDSSILDHERIEIIRVIKVYVWGSEISGQKRGESFLSYSSHDDIPNTSRKLNLVNSGWTAIASLTSFGIPGPSRRHLIAEHISLLSRLATFPPAYAHSASSLTMASTSAVRRWKSILDFNPPRFVSILALANSTTIRNSWGDTTIVRNISCFMHMTFDFN